VPFKSFCLRKLQMGTPLAEDWDVPDAALLPVGANGPHHARGPLALGPEPLASARQMQDASVAYVMASLPLPRQNTGRTMHINTQLSVTQ